MSQRRQTPSLRWSSFRRKTRRVKTPTILQMESVECGAAALAIVLGFHGRFVPLAELRSACGVSRDGSKAGNIVRVARIYGLTAKGLRKEPADLAALPLPLIVYWNFNHFLVVEGFGKGKVYLNDPATGPRVVTDAEFDRSFTGVVLMFTPGPDFTPGGEPPRAGAALYQRLAGSWSALIYTLLVSLLLILISLIIPAFTKIFIDDFLIGGRHAWLPAVLLFLALAAVFVAALTWLQQYYLLRLEAKLAITGASRFFWHVLRLPMEFFTHRYASEISARVQLNDRLAQLLASEIITSVLNMLLIICYPILMIQYDVPLTLIGCAIVLLNLAALYVIARKRSDQYQKMLQERGKLIGASNNGLQMIETLKATGAEDDFFARWAGHQAKVLNAEQELDMVTEGLAFIPPLLSAFNVAAILTLGGLRVVDGSMTMGSLIAFQTLMIAFLTPVNQLITIGGKIQEARGDLYRLDDVLRHQTDPAIDGSPSVQPCTAVELTGSMEIRNLTFGYSRLDPPLIEDFNLVLKPGACIALVGGSGSGKSTVAKLLAGLYEPWDGEVLFDGHPHRSLPRSAITNALALVDQDIVLFEGSIRENLTLWNSAIPESQLVRAAKDACIHDRITARPGGYDAPVEEGGHNFSGGERQRLEIARALTGNPAILILDEATSALDVLTEQRVMDNIRRRGATCIIIAHRLSTIRECDEILVLDRGKLVQRGTHEQLLRLDGPYAQLIRSDEPVKRNSHPTTPLEAVPTSSSSTDAQTTFWEISELKQEQGETNGHRAHADDLPVDQLALKTAFANLASVLQGGIELELTLDQGPPLLDACRMAGKAQGINIHGASASGEELTIDTIARSSGVRVRKTALSATWWRSDHGPLVAYYGEQRQPVALLPVSSSRSRYELYDPVTQTKTPVTANVAARISLEAYTFYRSFPDHPLKLRDLWRFGIAGTLWDRTLIILLSLAAGILALAPPLLTGTLFGRLIPAAERRQIIQLGLMLLICLLAGALFKFARAAAMVRFGARVDAALQAAMWDRLLKLPVSFFRRYSAGDLALRAMGITLIRRIVSGTVVTALLSGMFAIFSFGLLFYYDLRLALVATRMIAVLAIVSTVAGYLHLRYQRTLAELQGALAGMALQLIGGISKIRVAGAENRAFARWATAFSAQRSIAYKARMITALLAVFNAAFPTVATLQLFAVVILSIGPDFSTGDFLGFNMAFGSVLVAAVGLSSALVALLGLLPLYERIQPILGTSPELMRGMAHPRKLSGAIEVNHLSFRYHSDGPPILHNVSLHINPGAFVAIVGPSGSGKSTLLRLLLGFERAESGGIYYDGQELSNLDVVELRRQFGVVLQHSQVLAGDILRNIIGSAPLSIDDAWQAARLAGLEDDIKQMPMGMYTIVGEGAGTLSGGQRQRLLIARAIATKPRILFFDEATSALDNRTQESVSERLEQLRVTRLVIAHRLSTIVNADQIVVLDGGKIVQIGTYEELLAQPGPFAQLARHQLIEEQVSDV